MKNNDLTPDEQKLLKDIDEYGQRLELPQSLNRRAIQNKLEQTTVEHSTRKRTVNPFVKYSSIAAALLILVISAAVLVPGILSKQSPNKDLIGNNTTESAGLNNQVNLQDPPELVLPDTQLTTIKADSYDKVYDVLFNIIQANEYQNYNNYRYYGIADGEFTPIVKERTEAMYTDATNGEIGSFAPDSVAGASSSDHSETNLQVAGVDEADIVKTDGKYIYILNTDNFDDQPSVIIVSAEGAQMKQISSFSPYPQDRKLDYFNPIDMFLIPESERLIIIASGYVNYSYTDINYKIPRMRIYNDDTYIITYDISDRSNPVLLSTNTQEGYYQSSRLTDGYLYIMSNFQSPIYSSADMVREDAEKYVPMVNGVAQPCKNILLPEAPSSQTFTTISALEIANPYSFTDSKSVLCGSGLLYVSRENIYLTSPVAYERGDETSFTEIIKLSYNNGTITPAATTKITGSLRDQFAIDETNGYLRLVSTVEYYEERFFELHQEPYFDYGVITDGIDDVILYDDEQDDWQENDNNQGDVPIDDDQGDVLTDDADQGDVPTDDTDQDDELTDDIDQDDWQYEDVFDDVIEDEPAVIYYPETVSQSNSLYILDSSLQLVGAIEKLAENEQIYSARFMGDTGYFVTFRQTDPLFSVDLSDPTNPKVLGELKIPGFSEYLHPYNDHLLLGIGMNADEGTGFTDYIKLSMFDISDPTNVIEKDTLILDDYAHSDALYNHKSVLIDASKDIIGFPAGGWDESGNSNTEYGDYLVYGYDENTGFTKKLRTGYSYSWDNYYDDENITNYYYCYAAKRGLYIGDTFYVVNTAYDIQAFNMADFTQLSELKIEY